MHGGGELMMQIQVFVAVFYKHLVIAIPFFFLRFRTSWSGAQKQVIIDRKIAIRVKLITTR